MILQSNLAWKVGTKNIIQMIFFQSFDSFNLHVILICCNLKVLISCLINVAGILYYASKVSTKKYTFAHYDSAVFIEGTAMKCLLIERTYFVCTILLIFANLQM